MDEVTITIPDYPQFTRSWRIPAHLGETEAGHVYAYEIGDPIKQGPDRLYTYFDDLAVEPFAQRRGIGRKLLERVIEHARKEKHYKVVGNSHRKRKAARTLYLSMGFKPHGREFRLDLT